MFALYRSVKTFINGARVKFITFTSRHYQGRLKKKLQAKLRYVFNPLLLEISILSKNNYFNYTLIKSNFYAQSTNLFFYKSPWLSNKHSQKIIEIFIASVNTVGLIRMYKSVLFS